jgi:hypothetical protein
VRARGGPRPTSNIPALGAVWLLFSGLCACGGSGDVVANVGASPIAKATVDHWISVMAGDGPKTDRSKPQYRALRGQVLGFLISSQWTLGEAAELGVRATDNEAKAQLELFNYDRLEGIPYEGLPQRGELRALFSRAHSRSDRLWLMKLAMLIARVEQRHLTEAERTITRAQIANYYDEHKSSFVLPERRDVEWIVTYSESTLQKAIREIRAGKNFVAVAKRVSLDDPPTISGMVRHPRLEPGLAKHVFAAKPHVITGPFRQSQNYYEFEVTNVTPARMQTLARSEGSIRRRLAARSATSRTEAFQRKWSARTSCRPGYVVAGCRQKT